MSLRIQLFILVIIIGGATGSLLSYVSYKYIDSKRTPQHPCTSVINGARFIDENRVHYNFNGVITWWPKLSRITLFGVRTDDSGDKVINRQLQLKDVKRHEDVISGKVSELKKMSGDSLPENFFLVSDVNQYLTLVFKYLNNNRWLMMSNDNWVMLCENK